MGIAVADGVDPRRSSRVRRAPLRYDADSHVPNFLWTDTCSADSPIPPSMTNYLQPDRTVCDSVYQAFAATHGMEAAQKSCKKELDGIVDAGVLSTPVKLPAGQRALSTRCSFVKSTMATWLDGCARDSQ